MGGCGQRTDKIGAGDFQEFIRFFLFWGPQSSLTTYPIDMLRALATQNRGHMTCETFTMDQGEGILTSIQNTEKP